MPSSFNIVISKHLSILYQRICVDFSTIYICKFFQNKKQKPIIFNSHLNLGIRITQRGLSLLWKPYAFGDKVSHFIYRYLCQHSPLLIQYYFFQNNLKLTERFATKFLFTTSGDILSLVHFRRLQAPPVSCYAIIIRVAASKPTS